MDPTVPDGAAAKDGPDRRGAQAPHQAVRSAEAATAPAEDRAEPLDGAAAAGRTLRPAAPWVTPLGGPAAMWRLYCETGAAAWDLATHLADGCLSRGIYVAQHTVQEYDGPVELADVCGLVFVLASELASSSRQTDTRTLLRIARDFRAVRPDSAVDGFRPASTNWHRVGTLQVCYTDDSLNDPDVRTLLSQACACHVYLPNMPFTGNLLEVFEPGKAQQVREHDQVASSHGATWNRLSRWGIEDIEFARVIRREIQAEVDSLEKRSLRALYRPVTEIKHNRLWLVLHQPEAAPPSDPRLTQEEQKAESEKFVASGARVVRELVKRLERDFPPFHRPAGQEDRRGAQRLFNRLYSDLQYVTAVS